MSTGKLSSRHAGHPSGEALRSCKGEQQPLAMASLWWNAGMQEFIPLLQACLAPLPSPAAPEVACHCTAFCCWGLPPQHAVLPAVTPCSVCSSPFARPLSCEDDGWEWKLCASALLAAEAPTSAAAGDSSVLRLACCSRCSTLGPSAAMHIGSPAAPRDAEAPSSPLICCCGGSVEVPREHAEGDDGGGATEGLRADGVE